MTGAWKGGLSLSNASDIGAITATSSTVQLLGNTGTTYAKGPWVQFTASTPTDTTWVAIAAQTHTSGGVAFAIDISIGAAGSEMVVVSNLNMSGNPSRGERFFFPFMIPAGTRIAGRMSSDGLGDGMNVHLETYQDQFSSVGVGSAIDTYGFSNAINLGIAVDPGATANTKGAYTQITASLTNDIAGFMIQLDGQGSTSGVGGATIWLIDIAVGAVGSEVVILPNLYQLGYVAGGVLFFIPMAAYMPMQIGAGTRISARAQCSTAAATDRGFGITFYGVRQ